MSGLDDRVAAGMREQLATRDERVRSGERPIGWKLGFGSPAALEKLALDRPLVGYLMEAGLVEDGAAVPVEDWTTPMLEPEIAVHLGRDVAADASPEDLATAIAGLSPAIELADLTPPPEDPRTILAGNIFHRHVLLGAVDAGRTTVDGIAARVLRDGEEVATTDDPAAMTGDLHAIVRSCAEVLEACGERLRAGEVIITGSVVAALPVAPGEEIRVELGPLGGVSVRLT